MDVSVIVCTRDRCASLARTLDSFTRMTRPDGVAWEIVLIDNGSTDQTAEIVRRFEASLPILRHVEPTPGLSHARNLALTVARGAYLVWTDDDVIVDAGWLRAYADAFARWPQAALFAGRVIPHLEPPVAGWFHDNLDLLRYVVARRDFGDQEQTLSVAAGVMPYGANYAIRASDHRAFRYDPALGAAPGRARIGEEVDVTERMIAGGATGQYLPDCRVTHCIPASRQTVGYVWKYYLAVGETASFNEKGEFPRMIGGVPLWLWRRWAVASARYAILAVGPRSRSWLQALMACATARGRVNFWLSQRPAPRSPGSPNRAFHNRAPLRRG